MRAGWVSPFLANTCMLSVISRSEEFKIALNLLSLLCKG